MLAFQGLNEAAADGTFLILPELTAVGTTATGNPAYFVPPTPGGYNGTAFPAVSGKPTFSHASGTFTTPFSVELSAAAPGASIRFTLDGSDPSETNGTVYTGPIAVSDSTRIRARVFEPGLAPGQILSRFWAELGQDVLDFSSNLPIVVVDTFGGGINQEFLAETLTAIIPPTGARANIVDAPAFAGPAGLKIRGSSSLGFPKKQYALETWDDTRDDVSVSLLACRASRIPTRPTPTRPSCGTCWLQGEQRRRRYAVRTPLRGGVPARRVGAVSAGDYAGVYVLEEKINRIRTA